jgi:hypothetical protein
MNMGKRGREKGSNYRNQIKRRDHFTFGPINKVDITRENTKMTQIVI